MSEIPQRRLAYDLRVAIDRCIRLPHRRYRDRLVALIHANPRGVWSSHVQHNLGSTRRGWLAAFTAREPALPGGPDAGSFVRSGVTDGEEAQVSLAGSDGA